MVTQDLCINYDQFPLFKQLHSTVLFRQLQTLKFWHLDDETHVLPYLGQIKDLEIQNTRIPVYSVNIDLPCVHTLQNLVLYGSTCSWMGGRTFYTLKKCIFYDWIYDLFGWKGVQMPIPYNFLSNCPCLQELQIETWHFSGLDSLIQIFFCDALEQGVWQDIRSVKLAVCIDWCRPGLQ
jgi:hypothetical protein